MTQHGVERVLLPSKQDGSWAFAIAAQKEHDALLDAMFQPLLLPRQSLMQRVATLFRSLARKVRLSPTQRLALGSAMCAYVLGYLRFDDWWFILLAAFGGLLIGKSHHGP